MKTALASYVLSLTTLLVLDGVWLGVVASSFYRAQMGALMRSQFQFLPAAAFYLIYGVGITFLVVLPALKQGNVWQALSLGALLGLCSYGAYNFTNLSVLKDWPTTVTLVDLAWGTAMSAVTSTVVFFVLKRFGF